MNIRVRIPTAESVRNAAVAGVLAVAVGAGIPLAMIPDGTGVWPDGRPERAAAQVAAGTAWDDLSGPFQRLFYLHGRVVDVAPVPFHCPADPFRPGWSPSREDLVATVRLYTWFGIPAGRRFAACGGDRILGAAVPESDPAFHPLIGSWVVAARRCADGCPLDAPPVRDVLGRWVHFAPEDVRFDDTACGPVVYRTEARSPSDVAAEFSTTTGALGLTDAPVLDIRVLCDGEPWSRPGGRVLQQTPDRAVLPWEGIHFTLVRDDPAASPAPEPEDGCTSIRVAAPTLVAFFGVVEPADNEQAAAPPPGFTESLAAFRRSLQAAGGALAARGVGVQEYYGSCLRIEGPDGTETLRPRDLGSGASYLARGLGVRTSLTGLHDANAIVGFVEAAFAR